MSIKDIGKKIKPYLEVRATPLISKVKSGLNLKEDIFIVFAIILIGLSGFGLGKLSALEKSRGGIQIIPATPADFNPNISSTTLNSNTLINSEVPQSAAAMIASESAQGLLVASKSGTKYHFPWCAGASQIAEKNKIWFDSYEEAQKAGYKPASNCKGLK